MRANIPYRIYGGLRFYDRLEIKNAISYLRIIFNPHDNPAFERSVANPTRGVGAKTLAKIRSLANKHNISYIQASSKMIDENIISGRGANGLKKFLEIILGLCGKIDDISLSEIVGSILEQSGLIQFHEKEPGEKLSLIHI